LGKEYPCHQQEGVIKVRGWGGGISAAGNLKYVTNGLQNKIRRKTKRFLGESIRLLREMEIIR